MADYECWPLWELESDPYPLTPNSLPLSLRLQEQVCCWASAYDATLDRDDPASSGFPSNSEHQQFIRQDLILQQQLQQELGDNFLVECVDRY